MAEVGKQDVLLLFTHHFHCWVDLHAHTRKQKQNKTRCSLMKIKQFLSDYSFKVREGNQG